MAATGHPRETAPHSWRKSDPKLGVESLIRGGAADRGRGKPNLTLEHVAGAPQAVEEAAEAAEAAAVARIVSRLSSEYILRSLQLLVEAYGDIRTGMIAQTIVTANTAHLDTRTGEGWRYAGIDETPPDEVRKPISIARLAESLDLPFETTRRHVQRLIDAGMCIRVEGGLIVPKAVLDRPGAVRAALANVGYVRKFVRDLQAAGLEVSPRPDPREPAARRGAAG